jgi:hypothetical protein
MSNNLTDIKKTLNTMHVNKLKNIQTHLNKILINKNTQTSPASLINESNKKSYNLKIKEIYSPIAEAISSKVKLNNTSKKLMNILKEIEKNSKLTQNEKKNLNSDIKKKLVSINNVIQFYGKEKIN